MAKKTTTKTGKVDLKKDFPEFYRPSSQECVILEIPEMKFFKIDGQGDPNTSQLYKDAIGTLYAASYTLTS